MTAGDVVKFLRAEPFRPFRIYMTDGAQYEVRHPEFAIVSPSVVIVGIPGPGGGAVVEDYMHLSISHISRIEEIKPEPASQS